MANQTTEHERAEAPVDPVAGDGQGEQIDSERARRAANLFDLRRLIGGLFVIYGVILTVLGIGASQEEINKAAGINLNLWVGLSLLVVGGMFLAWAFARPLGDELDDEDEEERETSPRFKREGDRTAAGAPAPVGADAAAFGGSKTTRRRPGSNRVGAGGERRFGRQ
jgi:hypothetical protein